MSIKLSYIIPAYNAASYITRCLDSIYRISLLPEEYEVIVVDDCSRDDTVRVIEDYFAKVNSEELIVNSNFTLLRQPENLRQGAARNRGVFEAKGEYIVFCDADDYMLEDGILNALAAVEKSHVDVCYFEMEYQDYHGAWHIVEMPYETHNTIMPSKKYLNDYYTCEYNGPVRCLYRAEWLRGIGLRFVEGVRWEDCDWTVKVYAQANEIQFVDGIGYRYVWNNASTSKQQDAQAMAEQLKAGVRLTTFAREVEQSLPGLAQTLLEEAKYRYVIQNIRLRNLTKSPMAEMASLYKKIDTEEWKLLDSLCLPKWETMVIRYHLLTLFVLTFACPIAAFGRKIIALIRKTI